MTGSQKVNERHGYSKLVVYHISRSLVSGGSLGTRAQRCINTRRTCPACHPFMPLIPTKERTQTTLPSHPSTNILLRVRILTRHRRHRRRRNMRRDKVKTRRTTDAGRIPPVMSWHQGSVVIFVAGTRAPARCGGSGGCVS